MIKRFQNYILAFTFGGTAGESLSKTFQIDRAWDFFWTKGQKFAYAAGAYVADPIITCTLADGASKEQIMNDATPIGSLFGTGEIPFILPTPQLIRGGSIYTATLTNLVATAYTVYLTFSGIHQSAR